MAEENKLFQELELNDVEAVVEGVVKKTGTGAHIPIEKKYLGRKVKIFIKKDKLNAPISTGSSG